MAQVPCGICGEIFDDATQAHLHAGPAPQAVENGYSCPTVLPPSTQYPNGVTCGAPPNRYCPSSGLKQCPKYGHKPF